MFCQRVLTWAPMNAGSFSIKMRKMSVEGNSVTAATWTNMVMSISGAPGISTTAPAVSSITM